MGVVVYQSTDASAPTLQGIVGGAYSSGWADGSLLQLLRKCLVTGYGSGAQAAGAGWTQSFQGTSEGVFRQGGGCQFYLHCLDDGSLTAGAREASINGGESYTAYNTGTALFPTAAQQAAGIKVRKSNTADSTQRPWLLIADNKTFYLFVNHLYATGTTEYLGATMFGDIVSYHPSDAYNCMVIGRITSAATDSSANEQFQNIDDGTSGLSAINGHYIARGYNQAGSAVQVGKVGNMFSAASVATQFAPTGNALTFPNPTDGAIILSRVYLIDGITAPSTSVRGFLRGMWNPQHDSAKMPREFSFVGGSSLSGRTFKLMGMFVGGTSAGIPALETSDTWD